MIPGRARKRVDANQARIAAMLETIPGVTVQTLGGVGEGCPDLLIGRLGVNLLLEVKAENGKLTGDQKEWHEWWHGQKAIVRNEHEAIAVVLKLTEVKP